MTEGTLMTPDRDTELVTVVIEAVDDQLHVRLLGEIDMSNATTVGDQLLQASQGAQTVRVDLAGLTFLDSSALRVLIKLRNDLLAGGRILTVTTPPGSRAGRILALSGVDCALGLASVQEQPTAPGPPG
jgi:anti-anti-sigma factor